MAGDKPSRNAQDRQVLIRSRASSSVEIDSAGAGDIVLVTGIEDLGIGTTLSDPSSRKALPLLGVDEPTLTMNFQVNTSPLAGREGKYVTSRQIRERLQRELLANVALRVEETDDADVFRVSGRGELHLTILIENMRREGYELAVSRPRVVVKEVDGERLSRTRQLTVDVEERTRARSWKRSGAAAASCTDMNPTARAACASTTAFRARGLIGFQTEFLTLTRGTGLMSHVFDDYAPVKGEMAERRNGVLISSEAGRGGRLRAVELQERGRMFVGPGERLYEGMIIGIHSRDNDLVVNPIKGKQLTNVRASGTDENVRPGAADPAHARVGDRVHRRRRAGRGDAEVDPHPQAVPEGARAQAGVAGSRVGPQTARFGGPFSLRAGASSVISAPLSCNSSLSAVPARRPAPRVHPSTTHSPPGAPHDHDPLRRHLRPRLRRRCRFRRRQRRFRLPHLEVVDRLRPVVLQQPRQRAVGQQLAAGLAARAVVASRSRRRRCAAPACRRRGRAA